ncbi:MAG: hypothetical protein OXL40_05340 [Bacteroidota bacterium]|nr:hypothetical protein [Bacteroidota bacterium]
MNFATWDWEVIVGFAVVLGFLWRLSHTVNRDMGSLEKRVTDEMRSLGERVARIEGALFSKLAVPKKKKSD